MSHPALTGLPPAGLAALTASLEIPFAARREQHLYQRRGLPRRRAARPDAPRRTDLTDHILATCLRQHLQLPVHLIADLLGADRTTISHAISLTRALLAGHPVTTTAPAARLRTLDDFRDYAATAGITIPPQLTTALPAAPTAPAPNDTPETQLI